MWYVIDCKKDAFLYYGSKDDISREELEERIQNDTLLDVLNKVYVQKGDILYIEAGTIHAIGKDVLIAEIQQNSNVTYRVYDYGRVGKDGKKRELHVDKALDVVNRISLQRSKSFSPHVVVCDYFTVDKIYLDGYIMKNIIGDIHEESFANILVLEGQGMIRCGEEEMPFQKGDSFFLPAGSGEFEISGVCETLITTV